MIHYAEQGIVLTWTAYNSLVISIERDMLVQVEDSRLFGFAKSKGWEVLSDAFPGVTLLRRDGSDISVPTDRSFEDRLDRIEEAILRIAKEAQLSPRAVLVATLSYQLS